MRESCMSGSVWGAPSNERPYRDQKGESEGRSGHRQDSASLRRFNLAGEAGWVFKNWMGATSVFYDISRV
jgi:hypothetical protein